jgi:WD40 repeat protein
MQPNTVAFSPRGDRLAVGGQLDDGRAEVRWYSWPALEPVGRALIRDDEGSTTRWVMSATFSDDGTRVAVGQGTGDGVAVIDVETGTVSPLVFAPWMSEFVALGHGDDRAYVANTNGFVGAFDLADADDIDEPVTFVGQGVAVGGLAVSSDDSILYSLEGEGHLVARDTATGRRIGPPRPAPARAGQETPPDAVSMAVSPDGSTIAVGYSDGRVVSWDATPASWVRRACSLLTTDIRSGASDAPSACPG